MSPQAGSAASPAAGFIFTRNKPSRKLEMEFLNFRWRLVEVAIADPLRRDDVVRDAFPFEAGWAVWKSAKINFMVLVQLCGRDLLSDAFELHCNLAIPADDERGAAIAREIRKFARAADGVKNDFEFRRDCDSHQRRLRFSLWSNCGEHAQLTGCQEFQQLRLVHKGGLQLAWAVGGYHWPIAK